MERVHLEEEEELTEEQCDKLRKKEMTALVRKLRTGINKGTEKRIRQIVREEIRKYFLSQV